MTTIKVSDELHDRLRAQAARAGRTIGAHLAALADLADRDQRLEALKQAIADTPGDIFEDYRIETSQWETVELNDTK